MKLKSTLFAATMMLVCFVATYAQSAPQSQTQTIPPATIAAPSTSATTSAQDVDELKKLSLLVAENKKLKEENAGLKDERDAVAGQRDSALKLVDTWKTIANEWQAAATVRKEALGTGEQIVTACQQQLSKAETLIAKQEARIYNLEHPGLLKEIFSPGQLFKNASFFGAGYGFSKLTK